MNGWIILGLLATAAVILLIQLGAAALGHWLQSLDDPPDL